MKCLRRALTLLLCFGFAPTIVPASAADRLQWELTVHGGNHDRAHVPVSVKVEVPEKFKGASLASLSGIGPGELTRPSLETADRPNAAGVYARELHFILPELKAGAELKIEAVLPADDRAAASQESFHWKDVPKEHSLLSFGSRKVLDFIDPTLDESSKEKRAETFKVYHHLYSPSGDAVVTKGPGGLFPHHRALFFGFNRITYDGKINGRCMALHRRLLPIAREDLGRDRRPGARPAIGRGGLARPKKGSLRSRATGNDRLQRSRRNDD